jgi:hypothetical protein
MRHLKMARALTITKKERKKTSMIQLRKRTLWRPIKTA